MSDKNSPIGLFDSGVGGLTVAHALEGVLPNEQLLYYGDTAHLPYGDKSRETIINYSLGITDFLLEEGCKVILIACNSASANAFEAVKKHVDGKAKVLNVVDPVIDYVKTLEEAENVGVIGTKATIDSGAYQKGLANINRKGHVIYDEQKGIAGERDSGSIHEHEMSVSSLATPLFVPMIEEGFVFDDISNAIIRSYLSRQELEDIDTLILGCTHYPIIRNQISRYYNFEVNVLDSARIVAEYARDYLAREDLLSEKRSGKNRFFVSDSTPYFEAIGYMFFNEKIHLVKKSIW